MGLVKISELPNAATLVGTEDYPLVQSGNTRKGPGGGNLPMVVMSGDSTGLTNSDAGLTAAKTALPLGGVIAIKPGTWAFTDSSASPGSNNHIQGSGAATTITNATGTGAIFVVIGQTDFSLSDFHVDAGTVVQPFSFYDCHHFTISRLAFEAIAGYGLFLYRCSDFVIEGIEGLWPSNDDTPPTLMTLTDCRRGKIISPKLASTFGTGIAMQGCHEIDVIDPEIDGQWFTLPTRFGNSGGTVTYPSSTTLTDTAQPFTGASPAIAALTTIRALPVRVASQSATSYETTRVLKTGATFITAGVEEGDLVITSSAYGMVNRAVYDETILPIDGWRSLTTGLLTATPTGNFTVYRVLISDVVSISTTTITHGGFRDLNGTAVTPSAGTRYEICYAHGAHAIFADGNCMNISVYGGRLRRGWGDQINIQGNFSKVQGVTVEFGYDIGIGIEEGGYGCTVIGNTTRRNGSMGIWVGDDTIVNDNICVDESWNTTDTNLGFINLTGSRAVANNNRLVKRNLTLSKRPIVVRSQAVDAVGNQVGVNLATGFSTTLIGLHPGTTNVTNTQVMSLADVTNVAGVGTVSGTTSMGANFRAIPAGTVGAPSLAFAADPDTGWYQEFAGQIDVVTDGASRMSYSSGGIVARSTLMPDADFGRSLGFSGRSWYEYYGYNAHLTNGIGVWGHAIPGAKPAAPTTLADVIAVLQAYGFCS